jgi:lysophospholipase L1-like esterase
VKKAILKFLFFAFLISSCGRPAIKNINSKGKNIICFGDSITYGEGASPGHDYPSLLARKLNLPVINAGKNGDTTRGALQRLEKDVLQRAPLLVIVELGANDYFRGIKVEETIKNLEEIITKIQNAGSMVAITEIHTGFIMRSQAKEIKKLARKYRCIFIPNIMDEILGNEELCSDSIHPNDKGYELIAQKVFDAIKPFVERNRF